MPKLHACKYVAMAVPTPNRGDVGVAVTISMVVLNGHLIAEHSSSIVRRPQLRSKRPTSLTKRPMAKRPLPHPPMTPPGTPLSHTGPMPASLTVSAAHTHALRLRATPNLKNSMLIAMVRLIALIWSMQRKVWEIRWLTR